MILAELSPANQTLLIVTCCSSITALSVALAALISRIATGKANGQKIDEIHTAVNAQPAPPTEKTP